MLAKLGERGFVRLDRELTEYRNVYCNPVVFTVYGHCLVNAAYREKYCSGILLQPGQFITSYAAMANECGITERQARNAFERLEESHLIERKPVGKGRKSGTLVTVANSQFVVIGVNEVGLKTSDSELRTYLQQGNYLISNKKKEEEKKESERYINLGCGGSSSTRPGKEEPPPQPPDYHYPSDLPVELRNCFSELVNDFGTEIAEKTWNRIIENSPPGDRSRMTIAYMKATAKGIANDGDEKEVNPIMAAARRAAARKKECIIEDGAVVIRDESIPDWN